MDGLTSLPAGREYATSYHSLITAIMIRLFVPPLQNPKIEVEVNEGIKRVDILMTNSATEGFFYFLKESHEILAPYIHIECKNYTMGLTNQELDQLAGRLNKTRGRFGILTYRNVKDQKKLLKQCQDYLKDDKYIICLGDNEIAELLRLKLIDERIDNFLDDKIQKLVFS